MRIKAFYAGLVIATILMFSHYAHANISQQNATLNQITYQTTSQPPSDYANYSVTIYEKNGRQITTNYYYTNFSLVKGFSSRCIIYLWHDGPGSQTSCTRNGATFTFTEVQNNDTTVTYGPGNYYAGNNMFTVSGKPDAVWVSYWASCDFGFSKCYNLGYASINTPPSTGGYVGIYGVYYAGMVLSGLPSSVASDMVKGASSVTYNGINYDLIHESSAMFYDPFSSAQFPKYYSEQNVYQNESNMSQYYVAFPYQQGSTPCTTHLCAPSTYTIYAAAYVPLLSLSISPASPFTVVNRPITLEVEANNGYSPRSYSYSVSYSGSGSGGYSASAPVKVDYGTYSSGAGYSVYNYTFKFSSIGSYTIKFTVTDAGGQTASESVTVTVNKPVIPPQCNPYTETNGNCTFLNGSIISTGNYGNYAGSGSFSASQVGQTSNTPVIANVILSNLASNQYLITCPNTPNQSNTLEYIDGNPSSRIAGDACLANANTLVTNVSLETNVSWSEYSPANGIIVGVHFVNLTQAYLDNLGYVGETNNSGSHSYNISDGYNTNTLIYKSVPAQTQYGIWSWYAKYANLDQANNPSFLSNTKFSSVFPSSQAPFQYLTVVENETSNGVHYTCSYNYTYSISDSLDSIQNANITIPKQVNSQGNSYVNINGINHKPYTWVNNAEPVYKESCSVYLFKQSCSSSGNSG
ncbi:MAG: hypothetical protein QXN59_03195, partial [Candidatus Micrarchaeaceae archaeon]